MNKEILDFYKRTSMYTDLGLYKTFAKNLTNDINELCLLQRRQIIHPVWIKLGLEQDKREKHYLRYEDEVLTSAINILNELLRRNKEYSVNRNDKDKVFVTCRGQAILLAAILKSKNIPARVRSGFASYFNDDNTYGDHWIVEYYDKDWRLADPDCYYELIDKNINPTNMNKNLFLTGAEAYIKIRDKQINARNIYYQSEPPIIGLKAAIRALFYDFNCLMNNEIYFLLQPKYVLKKNYDLNDDELKELDYLANLMLEPNKNFNELKNIWGKKIKFKDMGGAFNSI